MSNSVPQVGFVLVHGGVHDSRCWQPLLDHLAYPAVTVDLPGRGHRPADLATVTIGSWVDAIVDDLDACPFTHVVLVGHSLAGVTIPAAAGRRADRVAHLVFLASTVPPEGKSVLEAIPWPVRQVVGHQLRRNPAGLRLPQWLPRAIFCNDMTPAQTAKTLAELVPEAVTPFYERVSRHNVSETVPSTWILTLRDRAMPLRAARRQIRNLGPARVFALDAGHNVFTTQPAELAFLLNGIARDLFDRAAGTRHHAVPAAEEEARRPS
jgi:pimeloyl-ACP methyl ester carboxylesterase